MVVLRGGQLFQRLPLTAQSFRTRVDRANGNSELRRTKGITNLVDCAGVPLLNVRELAKTLKNPSFAARCGHFATMSSSSTINKRLYQVRYFTQNRSFDATAAATGCTFDAPVATAAVTGRTVDAIAVTAGRTFDATAAATG